MVTLLDSLKETCYEVIFVTSKVKSAIMNLARRPSGSLVRTSNVYRTRMKHWNNYCTVRVVMNTSVCVMILLRVIKSLYIFSGSMFLL